MHLNNAVAVALAAASLVEAQATEFDNTGCVGNKHANNGVPMVLAGTTRSVIMAPGKYASFQKVDASPSGTQCGGAGPAIVPGCNNIAGTGIKCILKQ